MTQNRKLSFSYSIGEFCPFFPYKFEKNNESEKCSQQKKYSQKRKKVENIFHKDLLFMYNKKNVSEYKRKRVLYIYKNINFRTSFLYEKKIKKQLFFSIFKILIS